MMGPWDPWSRHLCDVGSYLTSLGLSESRQYQLHRIADAREACGTVHGTEQRCERESCLPPGGGGGSFAGQGLSELSI